MSYRYLAHSADLGARLEASSLEGLYAAAVDLVRDAVVGASPVEAVEALDIPLAPTDDAERLFRFVRELVFLYDAEGFLAARVEPRPDADGAGVRLWGERFDAARHHSERQIKALTRHGYRLERGPDGYRAEVLFDL